MKQVVLSPAVQVGTEAYAVLTHREVARALNVSEETLENYYEKTGFDGPPRFRIGPRKWGYPIRHFRLWQERKIAEGRSEVTAA